MTDRKKSKRQKMRGHSTYGFGSKKKHRGFGNSGGKGNAGTGKRADSKKPSVWNKHYFGSVGFVKKNSPGPVNGVNLSYLNEQIDSLVKAGKAKKDKDLYEVNIADLGFQKVLGTGSLSKKFKITASAFSESAKRKIEESGGTAVQSE